MDPLQWLLITLKLFGTINWPWPVVLLPIEIEAYVLFLMMMFGIGFFKTTIRTTTTQ